MAMWDTFGRTIGYLRLSLTSACQMRCVYCRPAFDSHHPRALLTADEIGCVVRHLAARHGVHKVRLTGGDPTARPDLVNIIRHIAAIPGITDLAMTTNGLSLAAHAREYAQAGLRRVNISLDSLDAEQFARITGIDGLDHVLAGIDAAAAAGLRPIKLNTVVLRGRNEDQLPDLVRFAAGRGLAIRFIELMPMGPLADDWDDRYLPADAMRRQLDAVVKTWTPLPREAESAACFDAALADGRRVEIGFITPMSCNFCAACNRLRLTCDGSVYPCLMDEPRGSIMPAVRPRFDAAMFDDILEQALAAKAPEHPAQGVAVMTRIGG
jgi:GTP 3',8-cyclase